LISDRKSGIYIKVTTKKWVFITCWSDMLKYISINTFFIFFTVTFLANVALFFDANAHQTDEVPCMVDIVYGDDNSGVVSYFILRLQHKNQTGRNIKGVSVLMKDKDGKTIRNSDARCDVASDGINVGDTGQCEKILQTISGKMMQNIGYDVWIKLLDDQKKDFQNTDFCEIIGVKFS
jgi:hypothetical protein